MKQPGGLIPKSCGQVSRIEPGVSESVEPAVRDFDNPSTGLFLRVTFEFACLVPSALDVSNVAISSMTFRAGCVDADMYLTHVPTTD